MVDADNRTLRDLGEKIVPRWLNRQLGIAHKILYAIWLHADIVGDQGIFGLRRRFPGYDTDSNDAFDLVSRDRKIRRGRAEIDDIFAARLTRWLDDHRTRGNPYAMLQQLGAYFAAAPIRMFLITRAGVCYTREVDGTINRSTTSTFTPDNRPDLWARWWLYLEWPTPVTGSDTWGSGGTWGDGGVWGSDLTADEVQDLRHIPIEWNAAHCTGTLQLLNGEVWGAPPDGTWGDPGVWGGEALNIDISGTEV